MNTDPPQDFVPHILVVDDDPVNLEILCEYLAELRARIVTAQSGEAAWQQLMRHGGEFDLVVLDRMMPAPDGMEILKRIRSGPLANALPVVMQTGAATPDQVGEGLQAGAYYYLTKPYSRDALIAIVRAALHDRQEHVAVSQRLERQEEVWRLALDGHFAFRSIADARALAHTVCAVAPEPDMVAIGLMELMTNAIEHGNLGISYQEKSELIAAGTWYAELGRRLTLPEYAQRQGILSFEVGRNAAIFEISDQGEGFDWQPFLQLDPARAFDPNGRGIAMARMLSFSDIEFLGRGNRVRATVRLAGGQ